LLDFVPYGALVNKAADFVQKGIKDALLIA